MEKIGILKELKGIYEKQEFYKIKDLIDVLELDINKEKYYKKPSDKKKISTIQKVLKKVSDVRPILSCVGLDNMGNHLITDSYQAYILKEENYLLAQVIPTIREYLLYGYFSLSSYIQYIIYFDDSKLYFFELSKLTNRSIKNGFFIKFKDLQIKKLKKGLFSYKVHLEFKDGSKANLQIPKRVVRMYMQKQYSEKLFHKLSELKNKE